MGKKKHKKSDRKQSTTEMILLAIAILDLINKLIDLIRNLAD